MRDFRVEKWNSGTVGQWRNGEMEKWRSGAMEAGKGPEGKNLALPVFFVTGTAVFAFYFLNPKSYRR